MDLEDFLRSTPDELQHYGVKGMKWGRRKSTGHTIDVRPTSDTRVHNKRQSISAPGIGGLALMAYSRHSTNKQVNQQLSEILNTPLSDIDKKSLKNAREVILNYDYVEIKRSDKNKWELVT